MQITSPTLITSSKLLFLTTPFIVTLLFKISSTTPPSFPSWLIASIKRLPRGRQTIFVSPVLLVMKKVTFYRTISCCASSNAFM